jgi:uncharacterized protein (UPF0332 family)
VTADEATRRVVRYWLTMAGEALDSATSELAAGRIPFSVNRSYYACFYAATAVLLLRGSRFAKHSGLRAAIHRDLVKPGEVSVEVGRTYDRLFELRQQGDYTELAELTVDDARSAAEAAVKIVAAFRELARPCVSPDRAGGGDPG